MNIPAILEKGASWFASIGTPGSTGTKVFSVSGDVARRGVYELTMGSRLSDLLALAGAEDVKMVQIGGATGGVVPASMLETPLSYETVLGSGAIIVFNRSRDVIDFAYRTVEFLKEESCGECTPCREGTEVMVEILGRLTRARRRAGGRVGTGGTLGAHDGFLPLRPGSGGSYPSARHAQVLQKRLREQDQTIGLLADLEIGRRNQ